MFINFKTLSPFMTKEQDVINKLKLITKHQNIKLTHRGSAAIFLALEVLKKLVKEPILLVPDQGCYKIHEYAQTLGIKVKELKTNFGIIEPATLLKDAKSATALFFSSFAGHFAEQPIFELATACKTERCLLIEDATDAVCDKILCNGFLSDIIITSLGKESSINASSGGFISSKNKVILDSINNKLLPINAPSVFYDELLAKLNPRRINYLYELTSQIKRDLNKFKIMHRDKRGINVVTELNPIIMDYCKKRGYSYTVCPDYEIINERAMSIDLKKLQW